MNDRSLRSIRARGLGVACGGGGLAAAARHGGAESEEARAIKSQFARQVERIKSLEVAYKLDTTSNLSPEKLRAIPEYMNQAFPPQGRVARSVQGPEEDIAGRSSPNSIAYLAPVDENGLFAPPEPAADAPPLIKENQKKLREQYDRAIANMKAMEARGANAPKRDPSIRDRSEQDVTRAYNGKTLWSRKPTSPKGNQYEVWTNRSKPNFFQMSAYLCAVGLHVPDPTGRC